jgi:hypothetical protein
LLLEEAKQESIRIGWTEEEEEEEEEEFICTAPRRGDCCPLGSTSKSLLGMLHNSVYDRKIQTIPGR